MKTVRNLSAILLVGALIALAGSVALGLAQGPEPPEPGLPQGDLSLEAAVASKFSYQGLLREDGNPVTGSRDMTFRLYSDEGCSTQVGADIDKPGVQVTNGLFSVELDVTHSHFYGQGLWLEAALGSTRIGCQEILPVPYALSLKPGAIISDTTTSVEFNAIHASSSAGTLAYGARGGATGDLSYNRDLYGYAANSVENIGVLGEGYRPGTGVQGTENEGDGIRARSYGEEGLEGYSYGGQYADIGVWGETNSTSTSEAGVYGLSTDSAAGVWAYNDDPDSATTTSYGMRAYSRYSHGIYSNGGDSSNDYGIYATNSNGAVRADATGTSAGAYGIYATSDGDYEAGRFDAGGSADGIWSRGKGTAHYGVYAISQNSYGLRGTTYVSGGYGVYTADKIYAGGGCVGCTSMLIAQNGSDAALEPGDVVAVVGIATAPSESYARPVLMVRKVDDRSSQGVVGVVEGRYVTQQVERQEVEITTQYVEVLDPEGKSLPDVVPVEEHSVKKVMVEDAHTTTEPAGPGEYLTIVYRGLIQVKVDASSASIQVGDLLASANTSGRAMRAPTTEAVAHGAIIGKAMEPMAEGQGLIWALVDLQ
jgi:hypothetical protein